MSRSRNTGMVIAVLTAIAFSGSGPFAKPLMLAGWSPNAVVVMRLAAAALVVMPVALWQTRADLSVWWRRWRWIIGYGVIALAAAQLFYYSAVARMPVTRSSRSWARRAASASISLAASLSAAAVAAAVATSTVPGRIPRCCPPPVRTGDGAGERFAKRIPAPRGPPNL